MKIVALLPMKANSERVKGKNFKYFAGKPLFLWILESLLKVDKITSIVINTDAREILKENGLIESDKVFLRDRKKDICGDLVSMNLIIEDDINNIDADIFLMTHNGPRSFVWTISNEYGMSLRNHNNVFLFRWLDY